MSNQAIKCPHCSNVISLTEALVGDALKERLGKERAAIERAVAGEMRAKLENEIKDQAERLRLEADRVKAMAEAETALRVKLREAEDKARDAELLAARRFDEERTKFEQDVARRATDELQLKVAERDRQIEGLCKKIEELNQKAEQGSQQLQGEVLEIAVEREIQRMFPNDQIEAVVTGSRGADLVQTVVLRPGLAAGKIVWELKRTKHWKNEWISKVKADCLASNADVAVIVTQAMPAGCSGVVWIDDVFVCDYASWAGVLYALRNGILSVCATKLNQEGIEGKAARLYEYVTGPKFRQQVTIIVDAFEQLRDQLNREKRTTAKSWAERERIMQDAIATTAALHGEVGGIARSELPPIDKLELEPAETRA